jgi:hypothetical protein
VAGPNKGHISPGPSKQFSKALKSKLPFFFLNLRLKSQPPPDRHAGGPPLCLTVMRRAACGFCQAADRGPLPLHEFDWGSANQSKREWAGIAALSLQCEEEVGRELPWLGRPTCPKAGRSSGAGV